MAIIVWPVDAIATVPTNTGRMLRETMSPLLAGATAARPLGARSGVRPGTSATTVTATSTLWTIGIHAGILDLESSGLAGPYAYAVNTAQTGAVTAAHATLARVDIVWVRLDDPAEADGTAAPVVVAGYTAGTGGGFGLGGGVPATPARCMVLATIQVPASGGGAPTVIWVAPYTVAAGGVLPVPAGVYPATPYVGQYVDDATLGLLRYNGTVWTPIGTPSKTGTPLASTANLTGSVAVIGAGVNVTMDVVAGLRYEITLRFADSGTVGGQAILPLRENSSGGTQVTSWLAATAIAGGPGQSNKQVSVIWDAPSTVAAKQFHVVGYNTSGGPQSILAGSVLSIKCIGLAL